MLSRIGVFVSANIEDIALGAGALCLSLGAGARFGASVGVMAFGALSIAYGVWITRGAK